MKLIVKLTLGAAFIMCSAVTTQAQNPEVFDRSNPFYAPSSLPFHAVPFNLIKDEHFKPAIKEGIRQQQKEIDQIANNKAAPDFNNTLVALEKSGVLLERANTVLSFLAGANTNPEIQKITEELAPQLAANTDAMYLNTKLFNRIDQLFQKRDQLKLDPESKRLLEVYHENFVLAGAKLSAADKELVKKLNQEEASLRAKFDRQLLAANRAAALILDNKDDVDGMSDDALLTAASNAKAVGQEGKWLINLQNTTQQPELQLLSNRVSREKLFQASWTRAQRGDENDTRAVIARVAQVRAERARIIGYKTHASLKLVTTMAKTPENVIDFLGKIIPPTVAKAREEAIEIQSQIDKMQGGFKLAPWDWTYYGELVRKAKYDVDDNEIKPYLEINNVLEKGVFRAANLLYGITFKERKDLPVYHEDVRVFEIFDKDAKSMALFYCDYYKRDNKRGGAWMTTTVGQSKLLGTKPVIHNVCNFPKPAPGQPQLVSWSNMKTMFHEFGHSLHGLFATQQYPSLSGTATARDFVEFPSQFNENWATDPKVLNSFAIHYSTGQVIPQALVEKVKRASGWNQGYSFLEQLSAAYLDMQWHILPPDTLIGDVEKFEVEALKKGGVDLPQVPTRYRSSYFSHIWSTSSGYSAGYYSYSWTEVLAQDAYAWFEEHGGLTRENGQRFRDMILSKGNTMPLDQMYRDWRGADPDPKAMLKSKGLVSP